MNHIKNILKYFIFPILVFIFGMLFWFFQGYNSFPWFDIPLHLIGGFAVGTTYFFVLKYFQKEGFLKLNRIFNVLFVVSLVALTTVFWEFYEFIITMVTGVGFQGTLEDTMLDFALGLLGGLFSLVFLLKYR